MTDPKEEIPEETRDEEISKMENESDDPARSEEKDEPETPSVTDAFRAGM